MLAIVYVLRSGEVTFITTPYRRRVVWVSLREGWRGILRCSGWVAAGELGAKAEWGRAGCPRVRMRRAAVGMGDAPTRAIRTVDELIYSAWNLHKI